MNSLYITALVVILVTLLLTLALKKRIFGSSSAASSTTCLILGNSNSGKTALFYRLSEDKMRETLTSMKENEASVQLTIGESQQKKKIQLVDIPGHERIRSRYQHYLPVTACIVFMVDSIDFSSHIPQVGEYLFDLLTNAQVVKRKIPILVVCNKSELSIHHMNYVKKELAVELNKIRATRTSQMSMSQDTQAENESVVDLVEDVQREFAFDENTLRTSVEFIDCSLTNKDNLDQLKQFVFDHTA